MKDKSDQWNRVDEKQFFCSAHEHIPIIFLCVNMYDYEKMSELE